MARAVCAVAVLLAISVALAGCEYVLGEREAAIDLYNPMTRDHVLCGNDVHLDVPSLEDIDEQNRCIAHYAGKGYRVVGAIQRD